MNIAHYDKYTVRRYWSNSVAILLVVAVTQLDNSSYTSFFIWPTTCYLFLVSNQHITLALDVLL